MPSYVYLALYVEDHNEVLRHKYQEAIKLGVIDKGDPTPYVRHWYEHTLDKIGLVMFTTLSNHTPSELRLFNIWGSDPKVNEIERKLFKRYQSMISHELRLGECEHTILLPTTLLLRFSAEEHKCARRPTHSHDNTKFHGHGQLSRRYHRVSADHVKRILGDNLHDDRGMRVQSSQVDRETQQIRDCARQTYPLLDNTARTIRSRLSKSLIESDATWD